MPFLVRIPFRAYGPNPYLRNPSIEGPSQLDDASAGFLVVPSWDGFQLARASRYVYRGRTDQDVAVEPPLHQPNVPRGRGRTKGWSSLSETGNVTAASALRYYLHAAQDTSIFAGQLEPFLVRVPFRRFGRNAYLWRTAQDLSVVAPVEASTFAQFFVRVPFKVLARSPYLRHYAQDDSAGTVFNPGWARNANVLLKAHPTRRGMTP